MVEGGNPTYLGDRSDIRLCNRGIKRGGNGAVLRFSRRSFLRCACARRAVVRGRQNPDEYGNTMHRQADAHCAFMGLAITHAAYARWCVHDDPGCDRTARQKRGSCRGDGAVQASADRRPRGADRIPEFALRREGRRADLSCEWPASAIISAPGPVGAERRYLWTGERPSMHRRSDKLLTITIKALTL